MPKIVKIKNIIEKMGMICQTPDMNVPKEVETDDMVPQLVQEHFNRIEKSDKVLVVNPSGYFGNSTKVEIGFAKGLKKPVYFLEKTNEPELNCLAEGFIGNDFEKLI